MAFNPRKEMKRCTSFGKSFSGTILAAQNLKSGSAEELKKLIAPIIELGFPIIGIVTDGQQSIRMAMESDA
ncbi:hypothetical protein [Paenibacillus cisolokensis]|jgi:hypothetical protein|uniref:hypothetical protein n=1 Tax=Paenibacillus TaxID=44249 RepID=UPI003D2C8C9D